MQSQFGPNSSGGAISGYTQTAPILTNGAYPIPAGTKRIEAMLCGAVGRAQPVALVVGLVVAKFMKSQLLAPQHLTVS